MINDVRTMRRDISVYELGVCSVLLCIPFLQLGITYYVSAQVIAFATILLMASGGVPTSIVSYVLVASAIIFFKIFATSIAGGSLHDVLILLRDGVTYVAIFLGASGIYHTKNPSIVLRFACAFLLIGTVLVTLQYVAILNGHFISFDKNWFITNQRTLSGIRKALAQHSRLRPVGFYGEPSYMAFVAISMLVVCLIGIRRTWAVALMLGVTLGMILLLRSLAGMLAYLAIALTWIAVTVKNVAIRKKLLFLILLVVLGLLLMTLIAMNPHWFFSRRIEDIASLDISHHSSAYIRIVVPFNLLRHALTDGHWLGLSAEEISSYLAKTPAITLDNAAIGLFARYGVLAPLILASLILFIRQPLLIVYLLMVLCFNGSLFSYDKVVILSIVIGYGLGIRRTACKYATGSDFTPLAETEM